MSNELSASTKENTISSREVAVMMDYSHKDILRKIDNLNKELGGGANFPHPILD